MFCAEGRYTLILAFIKIGAVKVGRMVYIVCVCGGMDHSGGVKLSVPWGSLFKEGYSMNMRMRIALHLLLRNYVFLGPGFMF